MPHVRQSDPPILPRKYRPGIHLFQLLPDLYPEGEASSQDYGKEVLPDPTISKTELSSSEKSLSFFFVGFRDLWEDHSLKGLFYLFVFFIFVLTLCLLERRPHFSPMAQSVLLPMESDPLGGAFWIFLFSHDPSGSSGSNRGWNGENEGRPCFEKHPR